MKRQRKPTLFEEIVLPLLKRRHDPAARKELWIEILGVYQVVLDGNEDELHSLGMPKSMHITREWKVAVIQFLFGLIASRTLLTHPAALSLLTDEDVDNLSLALGNFVDKYIDFVDADS